MENMARAGSHGRILVHAANALLPLKLRHVRDVFAADLNLSCVQRNASADEVQHGSFSGAIGADYRYKLSVLDGKGEIVEEAHFIDCACVIIFMNMA